MSGGVLIPHIGKGLRRPSSAEWVWITSPPVITTSTHTLTKVTIHFLIILLRQGYMHQGMHHGDQCVTYTFFIRTRKIDPRRSIFFYDLFSSTVSNFSSPTFSKFQAHCFYIIILFYLLLQNQYIPNSSQTRMHGMQS